MEHVEDFLGRSRISGHSGNGEGIHVPSLQAVVATSKNPCSGVHINSNISMLQNLTHVHVS